MIDARRLRVLRAVADHRTVTAAAAALYLSPSAVSQQLAALENETGHRLLERNGRGVRLTPPARSCWCTPTRSWPSWSGPTQSWPPTPPAPPGG
ncbi:LysR family transcriptional regulator [Nocardiopsis composta]